jgi:alkylation response protein AidB-like acyl-CoA dehydrogenase
MAQPRDFGFGTEETMLRDEARRFFKKNCDDSALMDLVGENSDPAREPDCCWDEKLWNKIVELGWTILAVPEEQDGIGTSAVGVAGLMEEAGRAAYPSPLLANTNATYVLNACDTDGAKKALGSIVDGSTISLAMTNKVGSWEAADTDVTASGSDKIALDGTSWFVQDAKKVDFFLVKAASDAGVGLYVVPVDAPGVTIVPDSIIDLTRDQAHVEFKGVEVDPSLVAAPAGKGDAAIDAAMPAILTMTAADMVGAGEWQLQTTAEYARTRVQYDRIIGFFQAVKHPIVDCMLAIDRGRSLLYWAASLVDAGDDRALEAARMAKSATSDAGRFASDRSVQLHGGIGYTWESDVHIFFKRSMHGQAIFGDGVHQRRELANLLIGPIDTGAA